MSCSGEIVDKDEQLIQIKPNISQQLKKQNMVWLITQLSRYVIGQKNHLEMKAVVTSINFMELVHIDVWNFLQQGCIVKIDVFIVGDLWNFMTH